MTPEQLKSLNALLEKNGFGEVDFGRFADSPPFASAMTGVTGFDFDWPVDLASGTNYFITAKEDEAILIDVDKMEVVARTKTKAK